MITKNYVIAKIIAEPGSMLSMQITYGEGESKIYKNLTADMSELSRFVETINAGNVSPLHIDELIEDFLP